MSLSRRFRFALTAAALAVATSACASAPNAFVRHDRFMAEQQTQAAGADRAVCPVVLSNGTDQQLDARYSLGGVQSLLGLIPAGRSLSFGVLCDAGPVEAFAVSDMGGLLGGAQESRTVSSLDPSGATRMSFTVTDRVRSRRLQDRRSTAGSAETRVGPTRLGPRSRPRRDLEPSSDTGS